jgi:hypothetical protein
MLLSFRHSITVGRPFVLLRMAVKMKMCKEQRYSDIDWGKRKYWKKTLSPYHYVTHKFHMDRPRLESRGAAVRCPQLTASATERP